MSLRVRVILIGVGFVIVTVLWFLFLLRPTQNRVKELKGQQEQARTEQGNLQREIQRLKGLQEQAPRLQAELARLQDAVPGDPRLPDFILQVNESASLAGVDFLTISPSLPAPFSPPAAGGAAAPPPPSAPGAGGQLQAVSVSISATGRYFEVLDFIVRLERLQRALRINSVSLAPGGATDEPIVPGGSPNLSGSFSMQMFLITQALPAPGAAPPPGAPTPSPAPGATPAPGSPAPGASPVPTAAPTPRPGG